MSARRTDAVAIGAALVLLLDQGTKAAAHGGGLPGRPLHNPELSLGLVGGPPVVLVVAMAAGLAWTIVQGRRWHAAGRVPGWALAAVAGGSAANLLDRAALGAVRDFLVVGPVVVNLADAAVLAGVLGATAAVVRTRPRAREEVTP